MEFKEGISVLLSVGSLIGFVITAVGVFYRLQFTTEQLKGTNDQQNERIDQANRAAQKANDGVLEIKSEMLRDSHKNEEDFARLENKVDNQGARIGEIAAAIKEQATNRDAMLVQIYEAITRGGRKSDV